MSTGPNLIIAGAMRSGTTSAYRYLAEHPDIFMSHNKEPTFLAFEGTPHFRGPGDEAFNHNVVPDEASYHSLFAGSQNFRYRGEASAMYMYLPDSIGGIKRHCPDAKILILLRNPIERAYSSYQYLRTRGQEPEASFELALSLEDERIAASWAPMWHYRQAGRYGEQLRRLYDELPRENIYCMSHDDLVSKGPRSLDSVLAWLDLPPFPPSVKATVHNKSGSSRHPRIERILRTSETKRKVKNALPLPLRAPAERFMRSLDHWRSDAIVPYAPMNSSTHDELREYYESDIRETRRLAGVEL